MRATVLGSDDALAWLRRIAQRTVAASAPDLIWAEVANSLLAYIRAGWLSVEAAQEILTGLLDLPITTRSAADLAGAALAAGLERGLTAYDACYLALATAGDAVLVTADNDLARVYERTALLD